ncbi:VCP-like ATPase [Tetrabaena socialis]|uniref:VCP-like ATPase n=1 Tax=Tetrabaena socialis TaxID=47790 RepID=A0A2J7ZLI3_9CHLO|nr:VCP-like ATPase [Tetrabaena socialis]|eukprot:PNH01127.1 VCP-like ATPase [Tetrabaena socialis]
MYEASAETCQAGTTHPALPLYGSRLDVAAGVTGAGAARRAVIWRCSAAFFASHSLMPSAMSRARSSRHRVSADSARCQQFRGRQPLRLRRASVLVLGATNRPGAVDTALLRPGRFSSLLFVPPPDAPGRLAALKVHCRRLPLAADVDLGAAAAATELYTGSHSQTRHGPDDPKSGPDPTVGTTFVIFSYSSMLSVQLSVVNASPRVLRSVS